MIKIVKKHPILSYLIITFGWTWIVVALLIFSGNADISNPNLIFIISGIISGLSPSIAGILIARITKEKAVRQRIKQRPQLRMILLSILIVPFIQIVTMLFSHKVIRPYAFQFVLPMVIMGLVWPIFSSLGEEFGWRGFLLPRFFSKHSVLLSGIIVGIVWSAWHLPMDYIGYKDYGVYTIPMFLLSFANLIIQSIIMTNIFTRSSGNIFLMILYHYTITSTGILTGALFQTINSPLYSIYESLISISLFTLCAVILYKTAPVNKLKNKQT